jgi:8-oxo-dGTP pyrophosphatase MutT (NUDIX family)
VLSVPFDFDYSRLYQFLLPNDTRAHGFMLPSTVSKMPWSSDFRVDHDLRTIHILDTSNGTSTAKSVTAAIQGVIDVAIENDLFPMIHGKHSEMYKILGANGFVCLERFAAPLFGVATRGAHLTAYVRTPKGIKIWVPRRSPHLFVYPSKLDTTVAGGVKADNTPFECIVAEADEEASLPANYVKEHTVSTGVITYVTENKQAGTIRPDVIYVFDIELPDTIIPEPKDNEVSEFYLWTVEEITQAMLRQEFKPNCNLVMIDFFIRHGIITQDNEADFVEISARLKRRLPIPTAPTHRPSA